MIERLTPQLQRAYEVLADGKWHERDAVAREMHKVILPGVAARAAEAARLTSGASAAPVKRKNERSLEELVEIGKRSLVTAALRTPRIEKRTEDGRVLLRLAHTRGLPDLAPLAEPQVGRQPGPRTSNRAARTSMTRHMAKAFEVLADSAWHDREVVMQAMMPLVDEDEAAGVVEYRRVWRYKKLGRQAPERTKPIARERVVASGRRSIALEALINSSRIERRVGPDGRPQVRLLHEAKSSRWQVGPELGGGIEPLS